MKLEALILRGGSSRRMGADKALMNFHGKAQQEYLIDLMEDLGLDYHFSLRPEQLPFLPPDTPYILDLKDGYGPLMGIYSGLNNTSSDGLIVLPCDMPGIDKKLLQTLIHQPSGKKEGLFFFNRKEQRLEVFPSMWSTAATKKIHAALTSSRRSIMEVIEQMNVHTIATDDSLAFVNINRPEDFEKWEKSKKVD